MNLRYRVICTGDSLVMGAWDTAGGWVDRLKQEMNRRYVETKSSDRIQVYNLGVGSETTVDLLKRLDFELSTRAAEAWPLVLMVGIGKNDSRIVKGNSQVSVDEYRANTREIVAVGRKYTDKIYFVEPLPIRGGEVEFKGTYYRSDSIAEYAEVLKEVTKELDVVCVGLYEDFSKLEQENYYAVDGVHLNDLGHEFVYRHVRNTLDELLA